MSDDSPTETLETTQTQALLHIANELTAIRQEVQKLNRTPPDPAADLESFECRICSSVELGRDAARYHALEHGAPRSDWEDAYE